MRGIVVGLGSMGKRRIRLMQSFFKDMELCGVDASDARREEAASLFSIPTYDSVEAAMAFSPAVGFVCTGPLAHAGIIRSLLERGLHVFTEINLVADGYAENTALAEQKGLTLFLSSTQLYRRETRYIEDTAKKAAGPLTYRYRVGQYLPDWHPWENYKSFFVGDRRTNGCREIFAIELPWLVSAFGEIVRFDAVLTKQTALYADCHDGAFVTLTHASGAVGQFAADVVARRAIRSFELTGEDIFLTWGGTPSSLSVLDMETKKETTVDVYGAVLHDDRYAANIVENAYVDELAAFFDTLAGKTARRHSFADDAALLRVIDGIEDQKTVEL
ncbi:MAG: Gfo/Idh/MocA family oxidoreductase [Oscillospiraceae bacterium]|nr:Gfo/Idh/MocA family oxidoreductase [Oscillospiraceae bacterium]